MLVRLVQSVEGAVPDAGDAIRNRDAREAGAVTAKAVTPDAGDAISQS